MNIPIISLEVQGMKHTIKMALMEHAALLDTAVQEALDKLCTEEQISRVVHEEARRQIDAALKQEVQNFFNWNSAGRMAVRQAVHEHLSQMYPTDEDAARQTRTTP